MGKNKIKRFKDSKQGVYRIKGFISKHIQRERFSISTDTTVHRYHSVTIGSRIDHNLEDSCQMNGRGLATQIILF